MKKVKVSTVQIVEEVLKSDPAVSEIKREQIRAVLTGEEVPIISHLLTQAQAAVWLGVCRQTVGMLVKDGYLKTVVIGDRIVRYRLKDLEGLEREVK